MVGWVYIVHGRYARVELAGPVEVSKIMWKGCDRGGETQACPATVPSTLSTNR